MALAPALEAIYRDPDSDGPRLAYAERCEAEDPERAELIRLQCRVARREGSPADRKIDSHRITQLLEANRERWIGAEFLRISGGSLSRGFPERAHVALDDDPALLERFVERHPVHTAEFDERDDDEPPDPQRLEAWGATPAWRRIRTFGGGEQELGPDGWRAILASPHLRQVQALHVGDEDATPEVARAIAASPLLELQRLVVHGYISATWGNDGVRALAGAPSMETLEELELWNCACKSGAAEAIAASPYLHNLTSLQLGRGNYTLNTIGPAGGRALGAATNLTKLRRLNLDFNKLTNDGGGPIPESEGLPSLEVLSLQACELTNVTVRCFMSAHQRMPKLRVLDLSHNDIDGGGLDFLARCPVMEQLEVLWLYHNNVWPSGVYALCDSVKATTLKELNLTQNPLGKESARVVDALCESLALQGLERLRIERCGLADRDRARLRDHFGARVVC